LNTLRPRLIGKALVAFVAFAPLATGAQTSWVTDQEMQQRLAAGEVVIRSSIDPGQTRGRVYAAIRIKAQPEAIWRVMTDCEHAPSFVPGLRRCRRINSALDGTWEVIEHEVKYSRLLPTFRYVFRADYQRLHRIDFRRVSGDLRDQQGTWLLEETPDASATTVEYELYVDPGFWIPQALVRHSLRKDLPAVLTALRSRVEGVEAARP
jgi:ribosome-associated toxin RatA of RatAB toxin-antitoxin module